MAHMLEQLTSLKTKVVTSEPLSQTERRLYWAAGSTLESLAGCIEQLKHDLAAIDNLQKTYTRTSENLSLNAASLTKPNIEKHKSGKRSA